MAADIEINPEDLARGITLTASLDDIFNSMVANSDPGLGVIGSQRLLVALQENMKDWSDSRYIIITLARHVNTGLRDFRDSLDELDQQLVNSLGDSSQPTRDQDDASIATTPIATPDAPKQAPTAPAPVTGGNEAEGIAPPPTKGTPGGAPFQYTPQGTVSGGGGGGPAIGAIPHSPVMVHPTRLPADYPQAEVSGPFPGVSAVSNDGDFSIQVNSTDGVISYKAMGAGAAGLTMGATVLSALAAKHGSGGGFKASSLSPTQRAFFDANGIPLDDTPVLGKQPMWKRLVQRAFHLEQEAEALRHDIQDAARSQGASRIVDTTPLDPPVEAKPLQSGEQTTARRSASPITFAPETPVEQRHHAPIPALNRDPIDAGGVTETPAYQVKPLEKIAQFADTAASEQPTAIPALHKLTSADAVGAGGSSGGGGFGGGGGFAPLTPLESTPSAGGGSFSAHDLPPLQGLSEAPADTLGDLGERIAALPPLEGLSDTPVNTLGDTSDIVDSLPPLGQSANDIFDDTGNPQPSHASATLGPLGLLAAPGGLAAGAGAGIGIAKARKEKDKANDLADESIYKLKQSKDLR